MNKSGLPLRERRRLSQLIRDSHAEFVILIGSWARGTEARQGSDIDLLVGLPSSSRCPSADRIHVICLSSKEIEHRVHEANDLAIWSLRFGVPLAGHRKWKALRDHLLPIAPWPNPRKKFDLASQALRYVEALAEMGDTEAAQDELRVALGHLARGILLERNVFPLSRPELHEQLREQNLDSVATMLDRTAKTDLEIREIHAFARQAYELIPKETLSA